MGKVGETVGKNVVGASEGESVVGETAVGEVGEAVGLNVVGSDGVGEVGEVVGVDVVGSAGVGDEVGRGEEGALVMTADVGEAVAWHTLRGTVTKKLYWQSGSSETFLSLGNG